MKVIKTAKDHEAALARIDTLLDLNPQAATPEADELEVLGVLVEQYEDRAFPLGAPDPIEAIRFRMDQAGLKQRDLVPFFGSRSRVSEVLNRKRPLTLQMIRALHEGLGIPAQVLLQEHDPSVLEDSDVEWERFPIREMVKRGWIKAQATQVRDDAERLMRSFFDPVGGVAACAALYKRTDHVRSGRKMDRHALAAWTARVVTEALEDPPRGEYNPNTVTLDFMSEVARLSWSDTGPKLAQEFLNKHGIKLVIEPHLPKTHLDGAAILSPKLAAPVIGLTIRHDRIDNFWFCLMHELAHVSKHLSDTATAFYDDLEAAPDQDSQEAEADELAGEALIPEQEWNRSPARDVWSSEAVQLLAKKLRIHTAIVAGRIRHTYKQFQILTDMVGQGRVRELFPEVSWP